MQKVRSFGLIGSIALTILLSACHDDDDDKKPSEVELNTRYIYTSTNSSIESEGNSVIRFTVLENGDLQESGTFPTGDIGDADDGDFDTQGAMRIIGDKLLVVNAGETSGDTYVTEDNGTISVFQINDANGDLTRIDQNNEIGGTQNIDSYGKRPVSLDATTIDGTTWVVVANQQDTPHCITLTEANTLETCLDQYGNPLSDYLRDEDAFSRNIYLYRFDKQSGVLTPVKRLATYDARVSGPAQVGFSPDKTKLVVTTVGIAHVDYPANEALSEPGHTFLYDVNADSDNFELENARYFANDGIMVSVGFSWSSDSRYVYVSNAVLSDQWVSNDLTLNNASITALDVTDTANVFNSDPSQGSLPSGTGAIRSDSRPAACWTWLAKGDNRLYSVAFRTNDVANHRVNGSILQLDEVVPRRNVPDADSKDMYITYDEKTAYVLGGYISHTVSIYDVDSDGLLTEKANSPINVQASRPNGENLAETEHFYIGIAGYPNAYVGF